MDIKEDSFSDLLLKESFFLLIKPENKIYLNTSIKNLFFEDLGDLDLILTNYNCRCEKNN